jgi:hypothetical protein
LTSAGGAGHLVAVRFQSLRPGLLVAILSFAAWAAPARAASTHRVIVEAASTERRAQVVTFAFPADGPKSARLRAAGGESVPLQVDSRGQATFVVPAQPAGQSLAFTLVDGPVFGNQITVTRAREDLGINVQDRRAIVYQSPDIDPKFIRAGYLHPLFTPSGIVVTGDYPANHAHHHGIWTSWSRAQFQGRATNFWEMAEQKGTTEFAGLDHVWNGPVHGGFMAKQQLVDFTSGKPVAALNETWEVTAYDVWDPRFPVRAFDLVVNQTCATPDPVLLPKHLYGFLGIRGRDEWNGKEAMTVLTSEGATTRETANTSRVRWCYIGGKVEGDAIAGIAILSHPQNVRAPEPIRVHPDMPFLSFAPVQTGDLTISPDRPFSAQYRILVFDGPPDRARLEAYWQGYATAARVTLERQ